MTREQRQKIEMLPKPDKQFACSLCELIDEMSSWNGYDDMIAILKELLARFI